MKDGLKTMFKIEISMDGSGDYYLQWPEIYQWHMLSVLKLRVMDVL